MLRKDVIARSKAREISLQALYQWHMAGDTLAEIEMQFYTHKSMKKVDVDYFRELLHGVPAQLDKVEASFTPFLDRALTDLNPIELTVLRISCYELLKRPDVPYKVIINEALRLTKLFGAEGGYKYVNGVLDNVAKTVRKKELND